MRTPVVWPAGAKAAAAWWLLEVWWGVLGTAASRSLSPGGMRKRSNSEARSYCEASKAAYMPGLVH